MHPDTSKPTAVFTPPSTGGRAYTLSIALPGSIIANAQTHDLKTSLAGQIARAAAVFCVDEIVVFDDGQAAKPRPQRHDRPGQRHDRHTNWEDEDEKTGYTGYNDPNQFLYHVLGYLETPPHLRKHLFPIHANLRTAGSLPSLDMPHHLRREEWCQYREGVTLSPEDAPVEPHPKRNGATSTATTYVEAGLSRPIKLADGIPPYTRVTLDLGVKDPPSGFPYDLSTSSLAAEAVDPATPREETGYYWGYTTRAAASLSAVYSECPFEDGYSFSIGTSERGQSLSSFLSSQPEPQPDAPVDPRLKHVIIIFGGVAGLEVAVENDIILNGQGITRDRTSEVFDAWVNLVPGQGSRTIRAEEAVWLGLMGLRGFTDLAAT